MAYWLIKTEPESWSWQQQLEAGTTHWDGVRNHQAANNLKAMAAGDQAFFYHSGGERRIMGIVDVVRTAYPDPGDPSGRFVMVDVQVGEALPRPVTLAEIKATPELAEIALVRQSRLSVMPIEEEAWRRLRAMGGLGARP